MLGCFRRRNSRKSGSVATARPPSDLAGKSRAKTQHGTTTKGRRRRRATSTTASVASSGCSAAKAEQLRTKPSSQAGTASPDPLKESSAPWRRPPNQARQALIREPTPDFRIIFRARLGKQPALRRGSTTVARTPHRAKASDSRPVPPATSSTPAPWLRESFPPATRRSSFATACARSSVFGPPCTSWLQPTGARRGERSGTPSGLGLCGWNRAERTVRHRSMLQSRIDSTTTEVASRQCPQKPFCFQRPVASTESPSLTPRQRSRTRRGPPSG